MYILSIIAVIAVIILSGWYNQGLWGYLIDTPSFLLILILWIPIMLSSGLFGDFGKAFQFDNVKSSVLAFQLGESSNNKILVSKLEQKNFIIAPEHNCVVDEAGFEKYIIVE